MSTVKVRRYTTDDVVEMLDHIHEHVSSTGFSDIAFSHDKLRDMLVGNQNNLLMFCNLATVDGEMAGGMCAQVLPYIFSHEAMAVDHLLYVRREYRKTDAAFRLIESYVAWSKDRRVRQARLMNTTGLRAEAFAKFAEKLGFKTIGTMHIMEI